MWIFLTGSFAGRWEESWYFVRVFGTNISDDTSWTHSVFLADWRVWKVQRIVRWRYEYACWEMLMAGERTVEWMVSARAGSDTRPQIHSSSLNIGRDCSIVVPSSNPRLPLCRRLSYQLVMYIGTPPYGHLVITAIFSQRNAHTCLLIHNPQQCYPVITATWTTFIFPVLILYVLFEDSTF